MPLNYAVIGRLIIWLLKNGKINKVSKDTLYRAVREQQEAGVK